MLRRMILLAAGLAVALIPAGTGLAGEAGSSPSQDRLQAQARAQGFEVVGHSPLNERGMNAAPALHGNHAYIGSRTDGQPHHRTPGILVVDIEDPSAPEVVHEIGPSHAGNVGETTRELRVWPQAEMLIVLSFGCSSAIHQCAGGETADARIDFYDISGANAARPEHLAAYAPSRTPHEFFLWVDPGQPEDRALLFMSTPTSSQSQPNVLVADISRVKPRAEVREVAEWVATFPPTELDSGEQEDRRLHSLGVSTDGTRAYLAFLGAGFMVLDTSEVAADAEDPQIREATPPENRVHWTNPGAHSAVKLFNRNMVLVTDEVYGDALDFLPGEWGCPWGWVRLIDIADETQPEIASEYRAAENREQSCEDPEFNRPTNTTFTSYSSHNPTVTPNVALVTWHSSGLEAFSLTNPASPEQLADFEPEPLPFVVTEDPALSLGENKVVMWSYPIIKDGLIYVVDIRNGLYILRYTAEHADEIDGIDFLEGNSNLGDALRFEPAETR